jgi:hypothetical protein
MDGENDQDCTRGLQESDSRARAFIELQRPSKAEAGTAMAKQKSGFQGGPFSSILEAPFQCCCPPPP